MASGLPGLPEGGVGSVALDELVVGAELVKEAVLDDGDPVCVVGGVETVRDRHHGTARENRREGALEVPRRARVEERRRLVEDERVRVGEDEPGERKLLGLGRAERLAAGADDGLEPVGQRLGPLERVDRRECSLELRLARLRSGEAKVVRERPHENVLLLRHERDLLSQGLEGQVDEPDAADVHASAPRRVDAGEQPAERRLARAGRLLAGIHPPRTGNVEVGGVELVELPLETLRQEVALVTQEQHVFVGTLADNLRLARPDASAAELEEALAAVDALEWAEALPEGLVTVVGAGGEPLSPPQTQQLALARLVLADPHTLVLDEATSLLDPRAARHLERSLASVLTGRTVVAIAHRLHTAHDADRVAVVEDGLLHELGTHDELIEHGGAYAALWESWQS